MVAPFLANRSEYFWPGVQVYIQWITSQLPTILQLSDFVLYSGISEIHVQYLTDSCSNTNSVEATRAIR